MKETEEEKNKKRKRKKKEKKKEIKGKNKQKEQHLNNIRHPHIRYTKNRPGREFWHEKVILMITTSYVIIKCISIDERILIKIQLWRQAQTERHHIVKYIMFIVICLGKFSWIFSGNALCNIKAMLCNRSSVFVLLLLILL